MSSPPLIDFPGSRLQGPVRYAGVHFITHLTLQESRPWLLGEELSEVRPALPALSSLQLQPKEILSGSQVLTWSCEALFMLCHLPQMLFTAELAGHLFPIPKDSICFPSGILPEPPVSCLSTEVAIAVICHCVCAR